MSTAQVRRRVFFLATTTALLLMTSVALPNASSPGGSYHDDDGNVHEGYIEAIAERGVTKGCNPPSNNRFCPEDIVTRGQMAAFLVRALHLPQADTDAFSDDDDSTFEADINALAASDITRGCDPPANDRFCPDEEVSRGEMAAFLTRSFQYPAATSDHFSDDDGSTFEGDIGRLAEAGVTRGCNPPNNTRFCVNDPVRRDQMASFLGRALKLRPTPPPPAGERNVISEDTMLMDERMVLRAGESLEFRNGARLMVGEGASLDWQGTPTSTWSDDGRSQNLERDIEIYGKGDIMFMPGSEPSTIRFVEINLQPKRELDHYPLHWHKVGNDSRGTLVEGVVVKNSTNRAFVPHASHGITFRDTIAKNIAGEAYWWNEPPEDDPKFDTSNNSHDILYDHILADGIRNKAGDDRGFNLAAVQLGAGEGNVIRDSVARNIHPSHEKNCSGFKWPSHNIHQPGVWTAENLKTFGSNCHGIFVWQNTKGNHVVEGFVSTEGISHGAYRSTYRYRNVDVPYMEVHAVGWSVEGGRIGEVRTSRHNSDGVVTFTDVAIDRVVVDNASPGVGTGADYVFNNTGLSCSDVVWESVVPDTTVTIDGDSCSAP